MPAVLQDESAAFLYAAWCLQKSRRRSRANRCVSCNAQRGRAALSSGFLEMVTYAACKQMLVVTYISGFGLSQEHIDRLSCITNLQLMISMNGSTEEINGLSRDGYSYMEQNSLMLSVIRLRTMAKSSLLWISITIKSWFISYKKTVIDLQSRIVSECCGRSLFRTTRSAKVDTLQEF